MLTRKLSFTKGTRFQGKKMSCKNKISHKTVFQQNVFSKNKMEACKQLIISINIHTWSN